jgi:hypothetical protein
VSDLDDQERRTGWIVRVAAAILGGLLVYWAGRQLTESPFLLFPIAGVAIVFVFLFDLPQLLFSAIDAARHKVQGVEHAGRHEWYAFHGQRVRVFMDESGAPWFAASEIAAILGIRDAAEALRAYSASEAGQPDFARGERCLSEAGLRRAIKYSKHPDASALGIWLEREVLFPLRQRKGG